MYKEAKNYKLQIHSKTKLFAMELSYDLTGEKYLEFYINYLVSSTPSFESDNNTVVSHLCLSRWHIENFKFLAKHLSYDYYSLMMIHCRKRCAENNIRKKERKKERKKRTKE